MNFEDGTSDPYKILGLPFGSSIDVCRATYKSLSKIYHPDVFSGDKDFAKSRMSELNAAMEFLSNAKKKQTYDATQDSNEKQNSASDYHGSAQDEEYSRASQLLKENWEFACSYYPEIKKMYSNLSKLDKNTAFIFMAVIVENKLYDKAAVLVETLKAKFLSSKFGFDKEVQKFAEYAIINKQIDLAKSLNKALKILGEGSKDKIFEKITKDYPDFTRKAFEELQFKDSINSNATGYLALHNAFKDKNKIPSKEIRSHFSQEFKDFKESWFKKDHANKYLGAATSWNAFLATKIGASKK